MPINRGHKCPPFPVMASPTVWFKFSLALVPSLCGWAVRGGGLPTICTNSAGSMQLNALLPFFFKSGFPPVGEGQSTMRTGPGHPPGCPSSQECP